MNFLKMIRKANKNQLFELPDHYVWDGSIIKAEDGSYQLYASYWPRDLKMTGWLTDSKVMRCEAPAALGPYTFKEEISCLNEQSWAKNMTHNPRVYMIGDKYYLYYIGTHWGDANIDKARIRKNQGGTANNPDWGKIRFNQRTGIAVSDSAKGPWTPLAHNPILEPRPGEWDGYMIVNPAINVLPNGRIQMIYKSTEDHGCPLILGSASAPIPEGPYERKTHSRLFTDNVEDPFFWKQNGEYLMLAKDMTGDVCGLNHGGILYRSDDGENWERAVNVLAYTRTVSWDDGQTEEFKYHERPFLCMEEEKPRYFVASLLKDDDSKSAILVRELE